MATLSGKPAAMHHGSITLAAENASPSNVDTPRWHQVERIQAINWDRSYPYQLLVLRKRHDGTYAREPGWVYTLPIPPQSLRMDVPVAVHGQVTLGGYVEQHGGVPVRMIHLQGTTGVLPLRGSAPALRPFNPAEAIFAGTIQAASRVGAAARDLAQDIAPRNAPSNVLRPNEITELTEIGKTSGYYQWRLLYQFLERYQSVKLTDVGRDLRLALAIWKDEAVYLCTVPHFGLARTVPHVLEYPWSLQLKAHRRINLSGAPPSDHGLTPIARNPDAVARALKTLADARRIVANSKAVLSAVVSDVQRSVLTPLREATLFLKDLAGTPLSVVDLAPEVVRSAQGAVLDLISLRATYEDLPDALVQGSAQASAEWDKLVELGRKLARGETGGADLERAPDLSADPALDVFRDPEQHHDLFQALRPGELRLAPAVEDAVAVERSRVAALRRSDFESRRTSVREAYARYAAAVGLGSEVLDAVYGRSTPTTKRTATDIDLELLGALDRAAAVLDSLAASADVERTPTSVLDVVAGLAARSGIAFTVPVSKRAVPFPSGWSLERLAQEYLGSPDRWHEIATLNGLREPWTDEVGFEESLLAPTDGPWVSVADGSRLRVGERVFLASRTVRRAYGRILELRELDGYWLVKLDQELPGYKPEDGGVLRAWTPDTVRGGQAIYVPSQQTPSTEDFSAKGVEGVDEWDPMVRVAGVDLLLDADGDLVISDDGDATLAAGLANLTQQIRLYLSLPRGALPRHPEVGLAVEIGANIADVDVGELAEAARELVAGDPSFAGVRDVAVSREGGSHRLAVSVAVRGWDKLLPVSAAVARAGA